MDIERLFFKAKKKRGQNSCNPYFVRWAGVQSEYYNLFNPRLLIQGYIEAKNMVSFLFIGGISLSYYNTKKQEIEVIFNITFVIILALFLVFGAF